MIFELIILSFNKVLKWKKHTCSDIASQPVGLPGTIVSKEEYDSQPF